MYSYTFKWWRFVFILLFFAIQKCISMADWETELSGVKLGDIAFRFIVLYKL